MIATRDDRIFKFGTDGIRGNADQFPFTPAALIALGRALASWAQKKYHKHNPTILIGLDTRISGSRIKQDLGKGLSYGGVRIVDAGIIPTPAVCQLIVKDSIFDAGIMISASHNPFIDNGIKVFDALSCKISADDESLISDFAQLYLSDDFVQPPAAEIISWQEGSELYARSIISLFAPDFLKNVKVVLDCANGATLSVAPFVFRALGAQVHLLGGTPNGININEQCGALHPENLSAVVREVQADCGFAFDGDGDRVIAVNRNGAVKDGDDILAMLLSLEAFRHVQAVVGTVMTNQGFEHFLNEHNKQLIRTKVGDKYIASQLEQASLPLGGEASGHVIIKDYLMTGDALFVALKTLEAIMQQDNWEMETFEKYPQVSLNVPVASKKDLAKQPFAQLIANYSQKLDGGRLVVRYSGTENVLRIMAEAVNQDLAFNVVQSLAHDLQKALKIQ